MYERVHYNCIAKVDSRNCEMLIRLSQYVIWICRKIFLFFLALAFLRYFHITLHLFVESGILLDQYENTRLLTEMEK